MTLRKPQANFLFIVDELLSLAAAGRSAGRIWHLQSKLNLMQQMFLLNRAFSIKMRFLFNSKRHRKFKNSTDCHIILITGQWSLLMTHSLLFTRYTTAVYLIDFQMYPSLMYFLSE